MTCLQTGKAEVYCIVTRFHFVERTRTMAQKANTGGT